MTNNNAKEALARLDERIDYLQQALDERDWERLARLNSDIRGLIDPVMAALERSQLSATEVQQRLQTLETFVQAAGAEASQARAEAKEALEQVGQNRKAASAYDRVSRRNR